MHFRAIFTKLLFLTDGRHKVVCVGSVVQVTVVSAAWKKANGSPFAFPSFSKATKFIISQPAKKRNYHTVIVMDIYCVIEAREFIYTVPSFMLFTVLP